MATNIFEWLLAFYARALRILRPELTTGQIQVMAANAAGIAVQYAKHHPYHTLFVTLNVGLAPVLGASWLTTGLLKIIGFGPLGPITGSAAAWYQSTCLGAYIPAGSFFAFFQHVAMT